MSNYPDGCTFPPTYHICDNCGHETEEEVDEDFLCDDCANDNKEEESLTDVPDDNIPQWRRKPLTGFSKALFDCFAVSPMEQLSALKKLPNPAMKGFNAGHEIRKMQEDGE